MVQISEGIAPPAPRTWRWSERQTIRRRENREGRFREFALALPSTRRAWSWRHVSTVYAPFYRVVDVAVIVNARSARSWIQAGWIVEEYLEDIGYRAQITPLGREVIRRAA